jgi:hypothetical protein
MGEFLQNTVSCTHGDAKDQPEPKNKRAFPVFFYRLILEQQPKRFHVSLLRPAASGLFLGEGLLYGLLPIAFDLERIRFGPRCVLGFGVARICMSLCAGFSHALIMLRSAGLCTSSVSLRLIARPARFVRRHSVLDSSSKNQTATNTCVNIFG